MEQRDKEIWIESNLGNQIAEVRCAEPSKHSKLMVLVCVGEYLNYIPHINKGADPYVIRKIAPCSSVNIECHSACRFIKPFNI